MPVSAVKHAVSIGNGGAYTINEVRQGMPLDYVADKLRCAIESAHANLLNINQYVPKNLPPEPEFHSHSPNGVKNDLLRSSAVLSLHYAVTAYLALHNMLAAIQDIGACVEIEKFSKEQLSSWLDSIEKNGSLLGCSQQ